MPTTWLTRATVTLATAATAALAAPALAAASPVKAQDPPGGNGTVKIDGTAFDEGIDNEPHVTCEFRVRLFDFDQNERGNLVFTAQPPTGSGATLLRRDSVTLSQDAAAGGQPDPDEVFEFSETDLQLAGLTPHPKQGYHVKLTVERIGVGGAGKHKVFWLHPCQTGGPGPAGGTEPSEAGPYAGGETGAPSSSPGGWAGGGSKASPVSQSYGTGIPVTGTAIGTIVLAGLGLTAAGAGLVSVRRRRHRFTV